MAYQIIKQAVSSLHSIFKCEIQGFWQNFQMMCGNNFGVCFRVWCNQNYANQRFARLCCGNSAGFGALLHLINQYLIVFLTF